MQDYFSRIYVPIFDIDAMGCQTEIAKMIIEQGADYVLALKANQGNLYEDVSQLFDLALQQDVNVLGDQFHSTIEKGHGGIEIRRYSVMGNTAYLYICWRQKNGKVYAVLVWWNQNAGSIVKSALSSKFTIFSVLNAMLIVSQMPFEIIGVLRTNYIGF